jgi:hypothetical protein
MEINGLRDSGAEGSEAKMAMTFQSVQESFEGLKKRFQAGEISRQGFIDEIKKLRLKDDQGRFWTIGVQTGKWYYFDGKDRLQGEPPSQKEKMICVFCGFENKLEAEVCARCGGIKGEEPTVCPTCGGPLQKPFQTCPRCKQEPEPLLSVKSIKLIKEEPENGLLIVRGIRPLSALLAGGLLGALLGMILGAFAGATGILSENLAFLPSGLVEQQGKLLGAVFLGLLGAVMGFVFLGAASFLSAVILNFVLSITGGLKLNVGRPPAARIETPSESVDSQDTGLGFNLRD